MQITISVLKIDIVDDLGHRNNRTVFKIINLGNEELQSFYSLFKLYKSHAHTFIDWWNVSMKHQPLLRQCWNYAEIATSKSGTCIKKCFIRSHPFWIEVLILKSSYENCMFLHQSLWKFKYRINQTKRNIEWLTKINKNAAFYLLYIFSLRSLQWI